MVKERPILFSSPMVRAILDGRKTMTRRIVKPQPPMPESVHKLAGIDYGWIAPKSPRTEWRPNGPVWAVRELMGVEPMLRCPHGQPGDRLWVRETWRVWDCQRGETEGDIVTGKLHCPQPDRVEYAADHITSPDGPWRPSIFMPRWASRLTLEITGVRVERLQDISEEDAWAEGVDEDVVLSIPAADAASAAFSELWESINGPNSWDANPYVWVIEFKRIDAANREG